MLSESDPTYNDQITGAFDLLLKRNTDEGYRSDLANKLLLDFTGKPPTRLKLNQELRELVENDLENMMGDIAVPDPYILIMLHLILSFC